MNFLRLLSKYFQDLYRYHKNFSSINIPTRIIFSSNLQNEPEKQLAIQYERLRKHFQCCIDNRDEISFLDLAHTLRIWVELKSLVSDLAHKNNINLYLNHHSPSKQFRKTLKGATHTYIPMASGIKESNLIIKGCLILDRSSSESEIAKRAAMGPPQMTATDMNFSDWMGAGVFKVPSGDPSHAHLQISREMIIKRVANTMGASHPAGMDDKNEQENKFDKYVQEIHQIYSGDEYPVTYYQLLEIAEEILDKTKILCDISSEVNKI
jgi:hypothetical protein